MRCIGPTLPPIRFPPLYFTGLSRLVSRMCNIFPFDQIVLHPAPFPKKNSFLFLRSSSLRLLVFTSFLGAKAKPFLFSNLTFLSKGSLPAILPDRLTSNKHRRTAQDDAIFKFLLLKVQVLKHIRMIFSDI